jgi:hypothetical protein
VEKALRQPCGECRPSRLSDSVRQGEIIRGLGMPHAQVSADVGNIVRAVMREMLEAGRR